MPTGQGRCPHCDRPVHPNDFPWQCPVCAHVERHQGMLLNCEHCHFGFRTIACPHCHRHFESFLLIGTMSGAPFEVRPAAEAFDLNTSERYTVGELKFKVHKDAAAVLEKWDRKVLQEMVALRFPFPIPPVTLAWYAAHSPLPGEYYVHAWVFDRDTAGGPGIDPNGQLSLVLTEKNGQKNVEARLVDVYVRKSAPRPQDVSPPSAPPPASGQGVDRWQKIVGILVLIVGALVLLGRLK